MGFKIGHVAIVILIMVFAISAFTFILTEADSVTNVNNNLVTTRLGAYNQTGSQANTMGENMVQNIDNSTEGLDIPDVSSNEIRGTEAMGIVNFFSKNVMVEFFRSASTDLSIPSSVMIFVYALIGMVITLLFVKLFWEKKVL